MSIGLFKNNENYQKSLSLAPGEEMKQLVDIAYAMEAWSDDDSALSSEESQKVKDNLDKCLVDVPAIPFYNPSCLYEKAMPKPKFASAEVLIQKAFMNYRRDVAYGSDGFEQLFLASKNPLVPAAFYHFTMNAPDNFSALFYSDFGKMTLKLSEAIFKDLKITPAAIRHISDKAELNSDSFQQTMAEAIDLSRHKFGQEPDQKMKNLLSQQFMEFFVDDWLGVSVFEANERPIIQAGRFTMGDFLFLLSYDNEYIQAESIKVWAERKYDPSYLFDVIRSSGYNKSVREAYRALASYTDRLDVVNFLFEQLEKAPFKEALLARKILTISQNPFVDAGLALLERSKDRYLRSVAKEIKESRETMTPKELEEILWTGDYRELFLPNTFTSGLFRHVAQAEMVSSVVRKMAVEDKMKNIKILSIGGAYGAESVSIAVYLADDFKKNPQAWKGIDPLSVVTIYSTDIDATAVDYTNRGIFRQTPCTDLADVNVLELVEFEALECLTAADSDDYKIDRERCHIEASTLDITKEEDVKRFMKENGRPDIIFYNMVDHQLEGSLKATAMQNILAMHPSAVITAPYFPITVIPYLESAMDLKETVAHSYLYIK